MNRKHTTHPAPTTASENSIDCSQAADSNAAGAKLSTKKKLGFTTTNEKDGERLRSSSSSAVGGNAQRAFTLIELLVVIAIIGVLSSVVLASLSGARESARVTRTVTDFKQIETGLTLWMDATNRVTWPHEDFFDSATENVYLDEIVSSENNNVEKYFPAAPPAQFGGKRYRYYNHGTTFTCGGGRNDGVSIVIEGVPQETAEKIDETMDGSVDLDCGRLRWLGGSFDELFYSLSKDQSL